MDDFIINESLLERSRQLLANGARLRAESCLLFEHLAWNLRRCVREHQRATRLLAENRLAAKPVSHQEQTPDRGDHSEK